MTIVGEAFLTVQPEPTSEQDFNNALANMELTALDVPVVPAEGFDADIAGEVAAVDPGAIDVPLAPEDGLDSLVSTEVGNIAPEEIVVPLVPDEGIEAAFADEIAAIEGGIEPIVIEGEVDVEAMGEEAASQAKEAGSKTSQSFTEGFLPVLGNLKAQVGALGIGLGAISGLESLSKSSEILARTESAIRATGGEANVSAEGLAAYSKELGAITATGSGTIQTAGNLLLRFTDVRNELGAGNDVFDRALGLALDLSVAFERDLSGSAVLLGRALSDPEKGITALRKAGVFLTEQQEKQIKAFQRSGDEIGAQTVLLDALEARVGGTAAAVGETLAGDLDRAAMAAKTLSRAFVEAVVPAIQAGTDVLLPFVNIIAAIPSEALLAGSALVLLAKKGESLNKLATGAGAANMLKGGLAGLGAAAGALASPVGIGVVALASLAIGLEKTAADAATSEKRTKEVARQLLAGERSVDGYRAAIERLNEEAGPEANITLAWKDALEVATSAVDRHRERLEMTPGALNDQKRATIDSMIEVDNLSGALEYMAEIEEKALRAIRRRGAAYEKTNHDTERAVNNSIRVLEGFDKVTDNSRDHLRDFANLSGKKLREWNRTAVDSISGVTGEFIDMGKNGRLSFRELAEGLENQLDSVLNFRDNIRTLIRKGASEEFIQSLIDMGAEGKQWANALAGENRKTIRNFEETQGRVEGVGKRLVNSLSRVEGGADKAGGKVRGLSGDLDALPRNVPISFAQQGLDELISKLRTALETTQLVRDTAEEAGNAFAGIGRNL